MTCIDLCDLYDYMICTICVNSHDIPKSTQVQHGRRVTNGEDLAFKVASSKVKRSELVLTSDDGPQPFKFWFGIMLLRRFKNLGVSG